MTRKRFIAGFKTQKELADFLGIDQQYISMWETFKSYPKKKEIVKSLERALNCKVDEFFPPEFIEAINKKIGIPHERVIDVKQLPRYTRGEYLLSSPEKAYELKEMADLIKSTFELITEREAKVLKLRFGLFEYKGNEHTLEEIAEILGITGERIRQIEAKALRKLKHPNNNEKLRDFVNI